MLWLLFAVLTAAAVVSVLWPLARPPRGVGRRETDIALYKAQLAEIERDEAQNLVALEDAEGAKVEAARRLMAAAETPVNWHQQHRHGEPGWPRWLSCFWCRPSRFPFMRRSASRAARCAACGSP